MGVPDGVPDGLRIMGDVHADQARKTQPHKRWVLFVAIGALVAVVVTGSWAVYRMLDPVQGHVRGNALCFNTKDVGERTGIITTSYIGVKEGRWLDVRAISMVEGTNFKFSGAGIQDHVPSLGGMDYPAVADGTAEFAGWNSRVELPARLGSGPNEALIFAVEPIDPAQDASLQALRIDYKNSWGLPYSITNGPVITAQADCSLDDQD